jgi:hypothetical protein
VLLILTLAPWSILSIISILMTKNNDWLDNKGEQDTNETV